MKNIKELLLYKILMELCNCSRYILIGGRRMIINIKEILHDEWLGIETSQAHRYKDCSQFRDAYGYEPSRYHTLRQIIDYLNLGPDDVFVDLGCGKGRAVFVAALENVKKAVGIDMDKDLIEIAQKNLGTIKAPHSSIQFICGDVAGFDVSSGTVFYMYNPFGHSTITAVIEKIKASLATNPRSIRIVLNNCMHRDPLDQEKWLRREKELENGSVIIWRNIL